MKKVIFETKSGEQAFEPELFHWSNSVWIHLWKYIKKDWFFTHTFFRIITDFICKFSFFFHCESKCEQSAKRRSRRPRRVYRIDRECQARRRQAGAATGECGRERERGESRAHADDSFARDILDIPVRTGLETTMHAYSSEYEQRESLCAGQNVVTTEPDRSTRGNRSLCRAVHVYRHSRPNRTNGYPCEQVFEVYPDIRYWCRTRWNFLTKLICLFDVWNDKKSLFAK